MKYKILLLVLLIQSCATTNQEETTASESDTLSTPVRLDIQIVDTLQVPADNKEETDQVQEDDCVFNNDYYGLTTSELAELGIEEFEWDKNLNQALITDETDSIFFSKGGCVHMGYLVMRKYYGDTTSFDNKAYWADQAAILSNRFGFKIYQKMLESDSIEFQFNSSSNLWIIVGDDNFYDNLIYNGVELNKHESHVELSISKYYN